MDYHFLSREVLCFYKSVDQCWKLRGSLKFFQEWNLGFCGFCCCSHFGFILVKDYNFFAVKCFIDSLLKPMHWNLGVVAHVIIVTDSVQKFRLILWTQTLDSGLEALDLGLRTQACQLLLITTVHFHISDVCCYHCDYDVPVIIWFGIMEWVGITHKHTQHATDNF